MESESVVFRMRSWMWLLLVFFGMLGMLVPYGFLEMFFDRASTLWAAGVISVVGSAAMCGLYAVACRLVEKRQVSELGLRQLLPDMGKGWLAGGGAMALSVLGLWMVGVYAVTSASPDWWGVVRDLLLFLFAAVAEELVCRAILLRTLEERWGTVVALVVSCLFFGFMHLGNDGASVWSCIAIAVSAVEAACFVYSRNLWMPIGAHWAWNFVQGNVLGVPVSGIDMGHSVVQASLSGPDWLTGGAFGAEASVVTVVVSAGVAAWLLWLAYKKGDFRPFRCPWRWVRKRAGVSKA